MTLDEILSDLLLGRCTVSMFASAKLCRTHNKAIASCVQAISARGAA